MNTRSNPTYQSTALQSFGGFVMLCALVGITFTAPAQTPVYRWTFDGVSGTGVPDVTAGGGTLIPGGTGGFTGTGLTGNANDFAYRAPGTGGVATNSSDITGLGVVGGLTVTFWVNPTVAFSNQPSAFARLLMMGTNNAYDEVGGGGNPPGFSMAMNSTNLEVGVGPSRTTITSGGLLSPYPSNQWLFIAFEYDGAGSNAFFSSALGSAVGNNSRNGALLLGTKTAAVGTPTMFPLTLANFTTSPGSISMAPTMTLLVGNRRGLDRGFFGSIDNVSIFTNLLTRAQLEAVRILTLPASVTLTTNDPPGASSFTNGLRWSNGAVPNAANDYYTAGFGLQTPATNANFTFGGRSLTLQPPGVGGTNYSFLFLGTNGVCTYTINNFTNNGGVIRSGSDASATCNLAGNMMVVAANSTINADHSSFLISAPLLGSADLTNSSAAGLTNSYAGTNSGFTGRLIVDSGANVAFNNAASAPGNPAAATPNQITTLGVATLTDHAGVTLANANGGVTIAGTLTLSTPNAATKTQIGVPITGGAGLTKTGGGTLLLNGVNSYSGTTTVSGGTLGGTGTIAGMLAVNSGATLAPGASIGTLNVSSSTTLGGTTLMEISTPNNADKLNVTSGTLNFGGTLTVTNIGGTLQTGDTFDLFDGTLAGSFPTLNLPGNASHWNTTALSTSGEIVFTGNTPPTASNFDLGVAVGGAATVNVMGKYVSDADVGDVVVITAVSTPASGTATIIGGTNILYTSTVNAANDSFTYTVSDGLESVTRTVSVILSSPQGFNKLSGPTDLGGGQYELNYLGIPGLQYALDESPNLVAPYTWHPVVTNTASGTGAISYTVPLSYPSGSFRTRHVP